MDDKSQKALTPARVLKTADRIRKLREAHGINRVRYDSRVRLTPDEVDAICAAFRQFFAPDDHLWFFGSRANLNARGGDIDLYVETTLSAEEAVKGERSFVAELYTKIGEQKIDVVLRLLSSDFHLPIYDVARKEGVQLV